MKNSTHYRLRALACALLASAAMLGACDDDDPNDDPDPGKKPPVTLTDQIQYDGGDLVGIKSAIYVAEEDGSHTFYLSPTEGLINAEQMKQADDYLRVMVESPKGTVNTASDPFEIEYKDISVKKTTMNDVASVELSADLVTKTRLNLYTYVELKSGKTLIARYQNTCTEERDVELTNQYEIDNRIAAVGSVVEWRNVREGNRRFCLYEQEGLAAPEEGAAGVEILLAALFSQEPQVGSYVFALGDAETAAAPADLAKGHWAAYVRVLAAKFDGVIDVAAQTSDYWFRLYDHKTYQTYYGEDAGLTGTIETHPNPAGGKEIYLRVNLTLKNGIGVEAEYYGVPTAATADAMDEETLKPVKPFEPYIKFLDKDNKDMLYWPVTAMEVRHDPAYRDSYTGDLLSGYCFYFRNAFTESIDADNTTPMFFLPDSYLDHEGEIDLPAEGTNCKWNLRFQYMYLSSYNGYGYSDKDKYCMRCPEKAAVTVKQENKEWIFKFSMVDWGVFSTWNPDPTGTGNTLIIEFRGKAAKYSGSKPNDLADDFYK